jgi:hypothetical protein
VTSSGSTRVWRRKSERARDGRRRPGAHRRNRRRAGSACRTVCSSSQARGGGTTPASAGPLPHPLAERVVRPELRSEALATGVPVVGVRVPAGSPKSCATGRRARCARSATSRDVRGGDPLLTDDARWQRRARAPPPMRGPDSRSIRWSPSTRPLRRRAR